MSKHIIHRFDFETICAGLLRLIDNPSMLGQYARFLDSQWFFHNDASADRKNLRHIIDIVVDMVKSGERDSISINYVSAKIPQRILDDDLREQVLKFYQQITTSEPIMKKINDKSSFSVFLDYLKLLQIARVSSEFAENYQTGKIQEAYTLMKEALDRITSVDVADEDTLTVEDIDDILNKKLELADHQLLPFGLKPFDNHMGGLEAQTLTLFIAVTNGGKTATMHHMIAQCIKHRIPAWIGVLEDRKKSFVYKLISCLTGIPTKRLKGFYDQLSSDEMKAVAEAKEGLRQYVKVEFIYGKSIDYVHKRSLDYDTDCRRLGKPVPLVNMVDYTGHVASMTEGDKSHEKMRNAFAKRKDFALQYKKIAIDGAQVNREGSKNVDHDKLLTHSDLAGAYDLAQVCDNIISLNRNEMDKVEGFMKWHLCKGRDASVGLTVKIKTRFDKMQYDMDEWKWHGQQPSEVYSEGQ